MSSVASEVHLMSSPILISSRYGTLRSSLGFHSANAVPRRSELLWPWKTTTTTTRRGRVIRCAMDESTAPDYRLRESGTKRRNYSGPQRIERAQEATKRKALAKTSRKLVIRPLLLALHERIRQNQWPPALEVFDLVRSQEWYVPEPSTYLKLFTMLSTARQPAEASRLFELFLEDKLRPTTAIFTALLSVYTKTNHFKKAVTTFESMRLYEGCVPDKYTYTAMIKGCCEAGLYVQARKIFDEMILEGVKPTIVTYNTLIFGYGKAGLFREIEHVLTMMEANNVNPDTVTWNTLIRVFGLHHKINDMELAYEGLLSQGLKPDIVTLNILISAYGTAGLFDKMESVVGYLSRYGYPMTVVTYNAVIEAYGKAGKIEAMETAFKEMIVEGVVPNRATFCAILNGYGQHGFWHNVETVLEQAVEYDAVNTAVYNAAIDAYQRAQNFEEMESVFEEMKREGCEPDEVTYSILIAAYKRVMRLAKAEELQKEWDALKTQSDCESS